MDATNRSEILMRVASVEVASLQNITRGTGIAQALQQSECVLSVWQEAIKQSPRVGESVSMKHAVFEFGYNLFKQKKKKKKIELLRSRKTLLKLFR
jgi:hypothetical protein